MKNGAAHTQASSSNLVDSNAGKDRYAETALPHLLEIRQSIDDEIAPLKQRREEVQSAIEKRVSPSIAKARSELGKTEGIVRAAVDGFEVKSDIPKDIKWDSPKLMTACEKIAELGEDPQQFIDFKLSVSEAKFKVLPKAILALVSDARVMKHGKEKLEITPVEKSEAAE